MTSQLISDEYRKILEEYHEKTKSWGKNAGSKRVSFMKKIIKKHREADNNPTIIDYGAGKGTLARAMGSAKIISYEPGIPKFANPDIEPADIVVSFGALEHVEPECIDNVLKHIRSLTKKVAYLDIGTTSSKHVLPDGRKAHLIVENTDWWIDRLQRAGFKVVKANPNFDPKSKDHNIKLDNNRGKGCVLFTCKPK